jgi:hypothetical protein
MDAFKHGKGKIGKDGVYRTLVTKQDIRDGIVFGEVRGFLQATTEEGNQTIQDGLSNGTMSVRWGAALQGGLTEAFPAEVEA